ncbi:MAG: hypothetical protein C0624_09875 [Desulfuromonas sp.]|mgnify:CR=1 FL=1|nr:MAG: hypothetical protein C0624_09875 [Desulfuromonas sp.]
MNEQPEPSPWMCHICDVTSTSESTVCSICFKTTCGLHLKHITVLNKESGLYELQPVCLHCTIDKTLG